MPIRDAKIVIMGSGGVGKSALTVRFVHDHWVERYDPTIEDSYRKVISIDGTRFHCEILDTAGTEQFMSLHSMYMRSGDGFILVYSLTSLESLDELSPIYEQIVRVKESEGVAAGHVPMCLVGNKSDLTQARQVPPDLAKRVSKSWNGVPAYETSARKNINVDLIFESILKQIMRLDSFKAGKNNHSGSPKKKRERKCTIL